MKDDSKFSKFLFKYFFITDIESLSTKEKIRFASIPILLPSIMLLWLYVKCHDWTILLLLFGIYVLYGGACYPLFFYNKLKTQYDVYSNIRIGASYQSISKNFSFLVPGLIMIVLTGGIILENINIAVFLGINLVHFWNIDLNKPTLIPNPTPINPMINDASGVNFIKLFILSDIIYLIPSLLRSDSTVSKDVDVEPSVISVCVP